MNLKFDTDLIGCPDLKATTTVSVGWDDDGNRTATITGGDNSITFKVNDNVAVINWVKVCGRLGVIGEDVWTITVINWWGFEWQDPNTGELHWHTWPAVLGNSNHLTRALHLDSKEFEVL